MSCALLVIDDNQSVRESLRFLLGSRGYTVDVAPGGPEGIALAAERPFDGALVDVHMPGMNGLAVCRELHAQAAQQGRRVSVWLMTGARTTELVKSAEEAGALAVFGKPFDFAELFRLFDEELGPPSSRGAHAPARPLEGASGAHHG